MFYNLFIFFGHILRIEKKISFALTGLGFDPSAEPSLHQWVYK